MNIVTSRVRWSLVVFILPLAVFGCVSTPSSKLGSSPPRTEIWKTPVSAEGSQPSRKETLPLTEKRPGSAATGWAFTYRAGDVVSKRLESFLTLQNQPLVSSYLRGIAEKLAETTGTLNKQPLGVLLVEKGLEFPFSVPGNRIYFPIYLLRQVQSESELAGLLAYELAKLEKRVFLFNLERSFLSSQDSAEIKQKISQASLQQIMDWNIRKSQREIFEQVQENEEGIYADHPEILRAKGNSPFYLEDATVDLLYRGGFDARGFAIFDRIPFKDNFSDETLAYFQKKLKGVPPVRNYLNTSEAFLTFKERISRIVK